MLASKGRGIFRSVRYVWTIEQARRFPLQSQAQITFTHLILSFMSNDQLILL